MKKILCMHRPEKPREPNISINITFAWDSSKRKYEIVFDNGFDGVKLILDDLYMKTLRELIGSVFEEEETK